jgi:hypothetical protein
MDDFLKIVDFSRGKRSIYSALPYNKKVLLETNHLNDREILL